MPDLPQAERLVALIEADARATPQAAHSLLSNIVESAWATSEEREAAQALVFRLWRVREAAGPWPPPASPEP